MAEATPTPEPTGTAPATPGASPSETPSATPESFPDKAAPVAAEPAKPVIPDKYEFKLGEGRTIEPAFADAVTPLFKEMGLTQEQVGKLVGTYDQFGAAAEVAQEKAFTEFMAKTAKDNLAAMQKEWGADFNPNLAIAQRGIARFLSDAGKKKLEDSGLGNDPEFLKAFYQAGKMIQEDQPPSGVPMSTKPSTFSEALYGKPN